MYGFTEYYISNYKFKEVTKEFVRNLRFKKERQSRILVKDLRAKTFKTTKTTKNISCPLRSSNKKPHSRRKKYRHAVTYNLDTKVTYDLVSKDSKSE
jgi:hypothetical protein